MGNLYCDGPGPHIPANGILGTTGGADVASRCSSPSCAPQPTAAQVNTSTLQDKAAQALDANAAYLAITTPTTTQAVTQVQRLTRETSAVIRLLLGRVETTDGT